MHECGMWCVCVCIYVYMYMYIRIYVCVCVCECTRVVVFACDSFALDDRQSVNFCRGASCLRQQSTAWERLISIRYIIVSRSLLPL